MQDELYHWTPENHRHKNGFILIANFMNEKKRVYDFRAQPQHFYDRNFQTRLRKTRNVSACREMKRISIANVCLHCCCLINFFSLCLRSGVTFMEFQTTTRNIKADKAKPKHKSRLWNSSTDHFSFRSMYKFNNGCMLYETCLKPYERWCCSLKLLEPED